MLFSSDSTLAVPGASPCCGISMPPPTACVMPSLGGWRCLGVISEAGGCSEVLEVRHSVTSRLGAMKVPIGPVTAKLLKHETELLRRCTHPNVVRIFDASDGAPAHKAYLVLERAECDLFERIEPDRGLQDGPCALRSHLADIARALSHVHALGVVHYDLKYENVLLFARSGGGHRRAKLCDFGLSVDLCAGQARCNEGLRQVTSVDFAPPEACALRLGALRNDKPLAPQYLELVDSWAMGVLLFACVYGVLPFSASGPPPDEALLDREGIVKMADGSGLVAFGGRAPLPGGCARAMERLLVVDVRRRLSVEELLADEWLRNVPVAAA